MLELMAETAGRFCCCCCFIIYCFIHCVWVLCVLCSLLLCNTFCAFYPHAFSKKAMGILQSRPSVRSSRYLLLNHWTKFNQIWCASYSHEWSVQRHKHIRRDFHSVAWVMPQGGTWGSWVVKSDRLSVTLSPP